MTDERTESRDVKIKTGISISPYLFGRIESVIKEKKFASRSDVISTALSEFFGRMDEREERQNTAPNQGDNFELLMLQLLDAHKELVDEANDLRKTQRDNPHSVRKVTFR